MRLGSTAALLISCLLLGACVSTRGVQHYGYVAVVDVPEGDTIRAVSTQVDAVMINAVQEGVGLIDDPTQAWWYDHWRTNLFHDDPYEYGASSHGTGALKVLGEGGRLRTRAAKLPADCVPDGHDPDDLFVVTVRYWRYEVMLRSVAGQVEQWRVRRPGGDWLEREEETLSDLSRSIGRRLYIDVDVRHQLPDGGFAPVEDGSAHRCIALRIRARVRADLDSPEDSTR